MLSERDRLARRLARVEALVDGWRELVRVSGTSTQPAAQITAAVVGACADDLARALAAKTEAASSFENAASRPTEHRGTGAADDTAAGDAAPCPACEEPRNAVLEWTCDECGWSVPVPMPGFAGDGYGHQLVGGGRCIGRLHARRVGGWLRMHPGAPLEEIRAAVSSADRGEP